MPNPYLETLQDGAPSAPVGNPYLERLQAERNAAGVQFRAVVGAAVGTDAEAEARARRVAGYLGTTPPAVRAAPKEAERAAQVRQIEADTSSAPMLRQRYTDADWARLAHDDSGALAALETAIGRAARYVMGADSGGGLPGDIGAGARALFSGIPALGSGLYGAAAAPFGLADQGIQALDDAAAALTGTPRRQIVGTPGPESFLLGQERATKAVADRLLAMPEDAGTVRRGVLSGLQSAGQNLVALPVGMAAGPAALLGILGGGAGGQSYGKARAEGASPLRAGALGAADATAEIVTERFLGAAGLLQRIKAGASAGKLFMFEVTKEVPGEIGATLWQNFNEWTLLHPDKSVADFVREQPEAVAQTIIATLVGGSTQIGAVKALERATGVTAQRQREAARAEAAAGAVEELATLAEASKVRQRDPEAFATFAQSMADDGVPRLYVDAQTLQQAGVDLAAVAQALPSVAAQVQVAVATGGDLVIPTGELLTLAPGQDFLAPLVEHARTAPEAMSRAEAQQYMDERGDALAAEVEKRLSEKQGDDAWAAARDAVAAQFQQQLDEAKRFTPDVNRAYASMLGNFYAVTAARLGVAPAELAQRYPLQIRADGVAGAGVLNQGAQTDTPAFKAWFGNSKVVDTQGKPLTVYHGTDSDFSVFDRAKSGKGPSKLGFWFTDLPDFAENFGGALMPAHISLKNPKRLTKAQWDTMRGKHGGDPAFFAALRDKYLAEGFDGVVVPGGSSKVGKFDVREPAVYAAFHSAQVKSAIGNRGTFDPNDPSILNQSGLGFNAWVGDATRVDIGDAHEFNDGEAVVVAALHGTTGDFTTFDAAMANIESDLGGGFYFTNNPADVGENYAGMGPDLTNKIQVEAERLESNEDLDPEEAMRIARDKWMVNEGLTMPVWVKMNNPAVLGGSRETFLDYTEEYNDDTEEYEEPTGSLLKVVEALRDIASDERYGDADIERVIGELIEKAADNGGLTAREFIATAKLSEGLVYAVDYESDGKLAPQEILRRAFEAAGFDGFIDQTVDAKFGSSSDAQAKYGKGMKGMDADTVHFIAFSPTQIKSRLGNNGEFDPSNPNILNQEARGQIALGDSGAVISLFKGADLSTLLHEAGHFFLEVQADMAARIQAQISEGASVTEGELEIVADMQRLLDWFGLKDTPERTALQQWHDMSIDGKRAMHEQFARGFERYAFEGRAPSMELQSLFQRFRAWLVSIYKDVKALNVELTDEVRGVMDRMLASTEAIQTAEAAREMGAIFATPEQAGMTLDEFKAYHDLATQATQDAIQELQARGLRDMKWLANAKSRKLKELQKTAASLRREVRAEVRSEVMAQPIYRAWAFLTGKGEAAETASDDPAAKSQAMDSTRDSLLVAVAKLGGISRESARRDLSISDDDLKARGEVFGKPIFRKEGGMSADDMRQALQEYAYLFDLDEFGRTELRELDDRVREELAGNPQYSAHRDWASDQPAPIVGDVAFGKLRTSDVKASNPDQLEALKKRRMVQETGGLHPDVVAEFIRTEDGGPAFGSGDELIRSLADAQSPSEVIEALTDQRMLERFGDLATPEGLQREADRAIHNEARGRFIAAQAAALEKAQAVREKVPGQRRTVDVLVQQARNTAAMVLARLKVRDIRPGEYAAAEARASRAAAKAFKAGDTAEAAAQGRNQLIQHQAARQALAARDEVRRAVDYLRRFEKRPKTVDADYLDQIETLLERFDLRQASLKAIDKRRGLADWVTAQREQGLEPDIPAELLNEAFRKSWQDLTLEELRGLRDTVKQIEHLGRVKNRLLTSRARREFESVRDELADSITANAGDRKADTRTPATVLGRSLAGLRAFGAAHIKAATWARVMDGGKDGGPFWEYLIRTANERGDQETTERAKATEALHSILAPLLKDGLTGRRHYASVNRSFTREQVIGIALNTGNDGNVQRLLGGEGWTMAQLQPVLDTLTSAEWRAVQGVWDHFETYRPAIGAKERRIYGKEPNWVEPAPRQVRTADGKTLDLRGGYYPIRYDPVASVRAEQHADAEDAQRMLRGAYTSASTRRGFTKARAEEVRGRPLIYSLAGVYAGVNDVVHDLAWHEWLIDANKILRSDKIDQAIRQHWGPDVVRQFKTWVEDIAAGDRPAQGALDMALGRLRQGVSASGLTFNLMSAFLQPLGITQSWVRVGPQWVGRGVMRYLANPRAAVREANGMSEFMLNRGRTRFRELNELRNQVEGQSAARQFMGRYGYWLMMRFQQVVDVPTWWGAYEKAVAEGNDDERAVALADQAVIDAQGGGQTKDQSAIERGGQAQKLFTVFYGFMNTAANLGYAQTATSDGSAKARAKLAANYLLLYSVPAVLGALLKDALTPGDADDEDLAKRLLAEQLSFLMGLMILVREFVETGKVVAGLEDRPRDYAGPAGLRLIPDSAKLAKQAAQGEFDDAFRKAAINVLGDAFGLPAAQINRSVTGAQALADGKTANPAALAFGFQDGR